MRYLALSVTKVGGYRRADLLGRFRVGSFSTSRKMLTGRGRPRAPALSTPASRAPGLPGFAGHKPLAESRDRHRPG
jgi:hypothetical protein